MKAGRRRLTALVTQALPGCPAGAAATPPGVDRAARNIREDSQFPEISTINVILA